MDAVKSLLNDDSSPVVLRDITRRPQLHLAGISLNALKEELVETLQGSNTALRDFMDANPNEILDCCFVSHPIRERKFATLNSSPKLFQFVLEDVGGLLSLHFDVLKASEHHQTLQCHKCLKFGHTVDRCRSVEYANAESP